MHSTNASAHDREPSGVASREAPPIEFQECQRRIFENASVLAETLVSATYASYSATLKATRTGRPSHQDGTGKEAKRVLRKAPQPQRQLLLSGHLTVTQHRQTEAAPSYPSRRARPRLLDDRGYRQPPRVASGHPGEDT